MSPDEVVAASSAEHLRRNRVPDAQERADREVAAERVRAVLGSRLAADGLVGSSLGTGWTSTFGVQAPVSVDELARAGWLGLDPVRRRIGLAGDGRWAVTADDGRVLAAVRVGGGSPDPVGWVLARARERGEVTLVDVLELAALRRDGHVFPDASPVLTAAADVETGLGRRDLVRWASGRRADPPVRLQVPAPARRRLVVAVSGVDGAGKSTLLEALQTELRRCDLPVSRVWLRPGMGLGGLSAAAAWVKRRRGEDAEPGINRVAADPGADLASRRGAVGWVWALLVTLSFLAGVRRQHAAARGVVLCDRHLVDALVTLDFGYRGADLRVQRWLLRRLVPRADVTVHLDVPVEEAVRRKPGDQIGVEAVRSQVQRYEARLAGQRGLVRLDATAEPSELVRRALGLVLDPGQRGCGAGARSAYRS